MTDLSAGAVDTAASTDLAVANRADILTEEQQRDLSKALFPDTHTDEVMFCGKKRKLTPLTIKWAKQVSECLIQFQELVKNSEDSGKPLELELLPLVVNACLILVKRYKWEDVPTKIEDEDVSLSELQMLLVHQVRLQDTNDFLLNGLRVLVGVMQLAEIEATSWLSIFNGRHSQNTTPVPSTT